MNKIKSLFIMKFIFSFITKKRKFELIIYNRKFKTKLKIDIEDYKKESGKYTTGERNGKGFEYDLYSNKKLFEGKYLNGKKNGKGKEYNYNGNIIFEGDYLNGERNGKGKEYDYNGILKFEGEYLNGKAKEYYDNGKYFKREYLNRVKI